MPASVAAFGERAALIAHQLHVPAKKPYDTIVGPIDHRLARRTSIVKSIGEWQEERNKNMNCHAQIIAITLTQLAISITMTTQTVTLTTVKILVATFTPMVARIATMAVAMLNKNGNDEQTMEKR